MPSNLLKKKKGYTEPGTHLNCGDHQQNGSCQLKYTNANATDAIKSTKGIFCMSKLTPHLPSITKLLSRPAYVTLLPRMKLVMPQTGKWHRPENKHDVASSKKPDRVEQGLWLVALEQLDGS
jgi:hypothetical protein